MFGRFEEEIIKLLAKHSEGMNVSDIASGLNTHRHTVSKYLYALTVSDVVDQREVGRAKLFFLKERKGKKS